MNDALPVSDSEILESHQHRYFHIQLVDMDRPGLGRRAAQHVVFRNPRHRIVPNPVSRHAGHSPSRGYESRKLNSHPFGHSSRKSTSQHSCQESSHNYTVAPQGLSSLESIPRPPRDPRIRQLALGYYPSRDRISSHDLARDGGFSSYYQQVGRHARSCGRGTRAIGFEELTHLYLQDAWPRFVTCAEAAAVMYPLDNSNLAQRAAHPRVPAPPPTPTARSNRPAHASESIRFRLRGFLACTSLHISS